MKPAAFEEREYESPLYNQLAAGDPRVWSPGQVFEAHVGIDYALFSEDPWLFRLHGYRTIAQGAVLSRYSWPRNWLRRRVPRKLPTFHLNLFIQAKRPHWGRRVPKHLKPGGMQKPFWRFDVDSAQQRSLERTSAKLGRRALIVYACPTFHEHADLWRHTTRGTIVENSTFPSIQTLSGHQAWYYCRPGAVGVPNPEYKPTEEPSLSERLDKLLNFRSDESWHHGIKNLASDINESLSEKEGEVDSRVAAFFDLQRAWQADVKQAEEASAIKAYLTVLAFAEMFNLSWHIIDSAD